MLSGVVLIASVLAFAPAQDAAAEAAPTETAPDEAAAPEEAAPADEVEPEAATDDVDAAPSEETAVADDAGGALPPADPQNGLNPWVTTPIQMAAGCGTSVACTAFSGLVSSVCVLPCLAIPYLGAAVAIFLPSIIQLGITPAAVGSVQAIVGDWLGAKRGTFLWTILASYGGLFCGGGVLAATVVTGLFLYTLVVGGGAAAIAGVTDPEALGSLLLGGAGASLGGAYLTYAASLVIGAPLGVLIYMGVPALTYVLTSEPKAAHDDGFRFPGFIEPNHAPLPSEEGEAEYEEDEEPTDEATDGDEAVDQEEAQPPEELDPEESLPTFDDEPGTVMGY